MTAEGAFQELRGGSQATTDTPPETVQQSGVCQVVSIPTVPLVVDLDGALVATDLLLEGLLVLAKKRPLMLLQASGWLLGGRARLKQLVAQEAAPDVLTLPYNRDVLAFLAEQKRQGRALILLTAADQAVARQVAQHLGCFDGVVGSDGELNLNDRAKRDRLVAEFGVGGFDYAGSDRSDPTIWSAARKVILVNPTVRLRRKEEREGRIERVFESDHSTADTYACALRPKHWLKNGLVFLPLIVSHHVLDPASLARACLAFIAFSLSASSIYLLNDLLDLPEDRRHPHKRKRVLASGQVTLGHALLIIPLLMLCAIVVALALPSHFIIILGVYLLIMLAYCLKLRDVAFVDAPTLGAGYMLRVLGGTAAAGLVVAPSLLAVCFLFFSGLALLKRYADLVAMRSLRGQEARIHAYVAQDSHRLAALGCGSSYAALILVAGHSALGNLHGREPLIWGVLALALLWITHMWLMARRGLIADDPIAFALTDRTSLVIGTLCIVIVSVIST